MDKFEEIAGMCPWRKPLEEGLNVCTACMLPETTMYRTCNRLSCAPFLWAMAVLGVITEEVPE